MQSYETDIRLVRNVGCKNYLGIASLICCLFPQLDAMHTSIFVIMRAESCSSECGKKVVVKFFSENSQSLLKLKL